MCLVNNLLPPGRTNKIKLLWVRDGRPSRRKVRSERIFDAPRTKSSWKKSASPPVSPYLSANLSTRGFLSASVLANRICSRASTFCRRLSTEAKASRLHTQFRILIQIITNECAPASRIIHTEHIRLTTLSNQVLSTWMYLSSKCQAKKGFIGEQSTLLQSNKT